MQWEFDEASFGDAAQVVMALNDGLAKRFDSRKSNVIEWLKVQTMFFCPRPGFWGTEGFAVSVAWKTGQDGKVLIARADPAGWLVLGAMIAAAKKLAEPKEKEGVA